MKTAALIATLVALAACGDKREKQPARTEPLGAGTGSDAGTPPPIDGDAGVPSDDDPAAALPPGSLPVWQAVIDRDRYLARRGQGAVLIGRMGGEAIAPGARGVIRWFIDETEGNGALAVRVAITGPVPTEGERLALRGAWALDGQLRWYWQVESVAPVTTPPPPPSTETPVPPGHQVISAPVPSGYRAVSRGKDGGIIVFGVIRSSNGDGDGWLIGDNSFGAPAASLTLPGERQSYGGHDLRHDDERWQLKRGVLYWVRIDRYRRKNADSRPTLRALTAPVRLQ